MNIKVEIKQWGNSKAVRLPKDFAAAMNLNAGDMLEFAQVDEQTIKVVVLSNPSKVKKKRLSLAERIAMTSHKTLPTCDEWDSIEPVGGEV